MMHDGNEGLDEELQTRCYAITGPVVALHRLEQVMRRIEWIGEQAATRMLCVFVDGQGGAALDIRRQASYPPPAVGEFNGSKLPCLDDEECQQPCYVMDIVKEP